MNTQIIVTEQASEIHAIPLDFEEGQPVTLLRGANVNGLTTKCNQPGKIIHIQYSDEFGLTYVVQFGSLGMYAYVGANGIEAIAQEVAEPVKVVPAKMIVSVTPLLDLYPIVEQGDTVLWNIPGMVEARKGVVIETMPEIDYCVVKFEFGALRSCYVDEVTVVAKVARENEALAFSSEPENVSVS